MNKEAQNIKGPKKGRGPKQENRGKGGKFRGKVKGIKGFKGGRVRGGGGMRPFANKKKFIKKATNRAEITALLESQKPFSLQRLMHDYKEIKNQTIPIPGVSASPLDDNFYEWHCNIKSSTTDIFKGAVLHVRFLFTEKYPLEPPKIYVIDKTFTHPNVVMTTGNSICLDILEKKNDQWKGWKTGYTVLSILLQLQNFFFDVDEKFIKDNEKTIQEQIISMNEFKCPQCKHKGSSNPYPEFFKVGTDLSLFKLPPEKYKQVKMDEICCFHRRTNFKETPLGLGITIQKIPRTGEIKGIIPGFSFISLKSYTKERIRVDFDGTRFTHWFPLYFGEKPEKFLISCTKAISMIIKGNTKQFSPDMILKVMPKFFNNVALNIITEKFHNSSRAFEILIYLYRILLILVKNYPEFKKEVDDNIEKFIKDEKARIKEFTPSLGDLLVMMIVSEKFKLEEILPAYIEEQMDRQIFWILQEIPEFESLVLSSLIDDVRAKVCFNCGIVGEQLVLFYYFFIKKVIFNETKTLDEFAAKLDSNYGNLPESEIDKHREEINVILKIDNFNDYYKYLGMTPPTDQELNDKLKKSFNNSLIKKYHGNDEVRFVPNQDKQAEEYLKRYPKIDTLIKDGVLLPENDPKWLELINGLDITSKFKYAHSNEELTSLSLIRFQRENIKGELVWDTKLPSFVQDNPIADRVSSEKYVKKIEDEEIIKKLSWKQLYLKLYLEDYVKFFPFIHDFKELYKILEFVNKEIIHFKFHISQLGSLKSDWNYVRVILSKLTSIKYLCFLFRSNVSIKLLKNILKGISNALIQKCQITHLKIMQNPHARNYSTKDLNILTMIDKMQYIQVLDLSNLKIDLNSCLRIRNHLYYYKKVEVLDLSNTGLNDESAKEIADGIMKAKSLSKIYLGSNDTKKGLSTILYNLSFQPNLRLIDISDNRVAERAETAEALYKLLKMSMSLETLICRGIPELNQYLTKDFYSSLGDTNKLTYLDLSNCGIFKDIHLLGNAIAFNSLKGGELTHLILRNIGLVYTSLVTLINSLEVTEHEHFNWYGFQFNSKIEKDSQDYYKKNFYCKLQYLDLSICNMNCNENINDKKENKVNYLKKLFSQSDNLRTIILDESFPTKYFIDMLTNALYYENSIKVLSLYGSNITGEMFKSLAQCFNKQNSNEPNPNFHIEIFDISKNKIGYNGVEILCKMLKTNKSIKTLNLFHNLFDVNGSRRIEEVLSTNSVLEELDIGYNRIKDVGFSKVINGIKSNPNSKLKFLGVKYNFIKDNCFEDQMKEIYSSSNVKLEKINLKNNSISEGFLSKYYINSFINQKRKIKSDLFDTLYYLVPERLERTVWISCEPNSTPESILAEIESKEAMCVLNEKSHLGIPLFIWKKRGRKVGKKKDQLSRNFFVEFIMPNSVNRMLKIASTAGFMQLGKKTKVFKAGTKPDFILVKKKHKI